VALGIVAAMAAPPGSKLDTFAVPGALGVCSILAAIWLFKDAVFALPLLMWMCAGLVALPYIHMAPKYLLPSVPAIAILIVLHAARARQPKSPRIMAVLVALGCVAGVLIVIGDTTLASSQRAAVDRLIAPRIASGSTVWAGGQWAFLEYAELGGAKALANTPPLPRPGDYIVISHADDTGVLRRIPIHRQLLTTQSDRRCGVFVLNEPLRAGFFSSGWDGYLPFVIGCGEVNAYDLYRVSP